MSWLRSDNTLKCEVELNEAVDGITRLPEHLETPKRVIGGRGLNKKHDCLNDWQVRGRERARLELFAKSTSDNSN